MGRVLVTAKIVNLSDLFFVERGSLKPEQVRSVEVNDALVDTGATNLSLPKRLIEQLGLTPGSKRPARTSAAHAMMQIYGAVRETVQGRDCVCDVAELPDSSVLIGQVPLELLDFVVDPANQRLIGNPEHGGEHMFDMF